MGLRTMYNRRISKSQRKQAKALHKVTLTYDSADTQGERPEGAYALVSDPVLTEEQFLFLVDHPFYWKGNVWVDLANGERHITNLQTHTRVKLNSLEHFITEVRTEQVLAHGSQITSRGWSMTAYYSKETQ